MNQYKTIQTETHTLLVDTKREIFIGDIPCKSLVCNKLINIDSITELCSIIYNGIIPNKVLAAHPKIEGINEFSCLPPNEDDEIENKLENIYRENTFLDSVLINTTINRDEVENDALQLMKLSYKQAKSETMFSLKDVKNVIKLAREKHWKPRNSGFAVSVDGEFVDTYSSEQMIQSLTNPKQYEFIVETIDNGSNYDTELGKTIWVSKIEPKIINNKVQGHWQEIK